MWYKLVEKMEVPSMYHRYSPRTPPELRFLRLGMQCYLTEFINQMVLESQVPYKIVNLLFTITYQDNTLAIFGGSWLSEAIK